MIGTVGVCSWSLRADSPEHLVALAHQCGVHGVQLALEPIRSGRWDMEHTREVLLRGGVRILSGMFEPAGEDYSTLESIAATGGLRPGRTWHENLERAESCAHIAERLGIGLVTFHAGFMPHAPPGEAPPPERAVLLERLVAVAGAFASRGVRLGLETGQESASTLVDVLGEIGHDAVGVNFDPANMILYAMGDPVRALELLLPWVVQVHLKDATPAPTPGVWGTEVPIGEGAVDWHAFATLLHAHPRTIDAVIEREAGENRVSDIQRGSTFLAGIDALAGCFGGEHA